MKTERIIIATLLVSLAFVLASCGKNESPVKKEEVMSTATSALPEGSEQLLALIPKTHEIAGWSLAEKPRFFGPGNLWEFIDGAADGYLTYGFQEVVSADFSQDKNQVVVDVYRMKDAVNAFGIYAQERNPDSQFIKIGVEGYLGGTALNFWAGAYYVKITSFEEKEAVKQEMQKIAGYISGKIGNAGSEPAQVAWFPKANQLARSVKFIPKDVLGQSYLANGFEVKYKAGNAEYKIILMDLQTTEAAKEAFAKYRQFVSNQGKAPKDMTAQGGEEGFAGEDSFYGQMMAVRSGNHVVVALGVPSPAAGNAALVEVLNNIKTKSGNPA